MGGGLNKMINNSVVIELTKGSARTQLLHIMYINQLQIEYLRSNPYLFLFVAPNENINIVA